MRATLLAVDLGDAPHLLPPRLQVILGQTPPYRLARQTAVVGETDHRAGEQFQGPASAAGGRGRTGGGRGALACCGKLALSARPRLFAQRRLQPVFDETALGTDKRWNPPTPMPAVDRLTQKSAARSICARLSLRAECLPPFSRAVEFAAFCFR